MSDEEENDELSEWFAWHQILNQSINQILTKSRFEYIKLNFPFFIRPIIITPILIGHNCCGLVGHRRRWCIVGWSRRSAWRTSQGPWSCPQWDRGSPALPATPATTTATTLPVCPAHMQPTPTAPAVKLNTPAARCYRGAGAAFVFELNSLFLHAHTYW